MISASDFRNGITFEINGQPLNKLIDSFVEFLEEFTTAICISFIESYKTAKTSSHVYLLP